MMQDYVTVPAGVHLCRVGEVREGVTRSGVQRWAVSLEVAEGEFQGRRAVWDCLLFSDRGRARARRILGALGLPVLMPGDPGFMLVPQDLEGRRAFVEVRPVVLPAGGDETVRRNEVPYDGWRASETGAKGPIPGMVRDAIESKVQPLCCGCGAKLGRVVWVPTGGDPHCAACAGMASELLAVLQWAETEVMDFDETCREAGYTDTDAAWAILHGIRKRAAVAIAKARGEA